LLDTYKKRITSNISTLESNYKNKMTRLKNRLEHTPDNNNDKDRVWDYAYKVSDPIIEPEYLTSIEDNDENYRKLMKHRQKMVKEIAQELIRTIEIEE
jgi:hypothetical protein